MKSNTIVYIDGENFLHRAEDTLRAKNVITDKSQITHFAVRNLLQSAIDDLGEARILYYGTRVRVAGIDDPIVLQRAKDIAESQRRLKRDLLNQGIEFVVAGSLRVRETSCRKCKNTTLVFKEKGVDVRMAVDIIHDAEEGLRQIIVSSDSDLLPAITVARHEKKARIIYVHHSEQPNYAMIKASHETRVFTPSQTTQAFAKQGKR